MKYVAEFVHFMFITTTFFRCVSEKRVTMFGQKERFNTKIKRKFEICFAMFRSEENIPNIDKKKKKEIKITPHTLHSQY